MGGVTQIFFWEAWEYIGFRQAEGWTEKLTGEWTKAHEYIMRRYMSRARRILSCYEQKINLKYIQVGKVK